MTDTVWTWRQFMTAMRKAGWKSIGHGAYHHKETGAIFNGWAWTQRRKDKYGNGEAWYEFAIERTAPTEAPF